MNSADRNLSPWNGPVTQVRAQLKKRSAASSRASADLDGNRPSIPGTLLRGAILIALVALAYLPVFHAGYIWDDDSYVTGNVALRRADALSLIWLHPTATPQYYPVTFTTFWLEYRLWGGAAGGYHAVNILLHLLNTLLVWHILRRLGLAAAWLAAALFAVHPVHVETVAWITEMKNTQSLLFYLLAFLAYWRSGFLRVKPDAQPVAGDDDNPRQTATDRTISSQNAAATGVLASAPTDPAKSDAPHGAPSLRWVWYGLALALFIAALLSKSVTASLGAAMPLVVWWKTGSLRWRDVLPLLPFLAIGAAMGSVTGLLEKYHVGASGSEFTLSTAARFLVAGRAAWFYFGKLVWPHPLIFVYPRWNIDPLQRWQWAFPVLAAAVVLGLWLARKRLGRGPLAAILFFGGSLFPALGFVNVYPMKFSYVADHFQYLASIGALALIASGVQLGLQRLVAWRWPSRSSAIGGLPLLLAQTPVLVLLAALTWQRGHAFADAQTLWRDTIAKNDRAWIAHSNLAGILGDHGDFVGAIEHDRRALELRDDPFLRVNLGQDVVKAGQMQQGMDLIRQAIRQAPSSGDGYYALGLIHSERGEFERAIAEYQRAVAIDPRHAMALINMGVANRNLGRMDRAIACYQQALALPDGSSSVEAHLNLGIAYFSLHRIDEALSQFALAHDADPADARPLNAAGVIKLIQSKLDEAAGDFRAAISADPNFVEGYARLGQTLQAKGDLPGAVSAYRQALALDPENVMARQAIALLRAKGRIQ